MKNKNKNTEKRNSEKKNPASAFLKSTGHYIKTKYPFLILLLLGYVAVSALVFAKITTSETVANFSINDFEIGQISDRTIIAEKNIPADDANPVTITAGEKIIKKGFVITEEAYAKLKKMIASPLYIDYRAFANKVLYLLVISIMYYLLFLLLPFGRKIKLQEPLLQVIFLIIVFFAASFGSKLPLCQNSYALCMIIPASLFAMIVTILYGQASAVLFSFVMSFAVLGSGNWELVPFLFTLASSLAAVAIVRKVERRIDLVFAAIILALCDLVFFVLQQI